MGVLDALESGIARANGRSYWQVRYRDGRVISEWGGIDWSEIPRSGLIEARLLCPNGETGVLGNPVDASDRLFQFKVAVMSPSTDRETLAHVLGIVVDTAGNAKCLAWEPSHGRLLNFEDNVWNMTYQNVGQLGFANLGMKAD